VDKVVLRWKLLLNAYVGKEKSSKIIIIANYIVKLILKFAWKNKGLRTVNTITKNSIVVELNLLNFKVYHKDTLMTTEYYWRKN
jgi:hypothetical protein